MKVAIIGKQGVDPAGVLYETILSARGIDVAWFAADEVVSQLRTDGLQSWFDPTFALCDALGVIDVEPLMGAAGNAVAIAIENAGAVQCNSVAALALTGNKWLSYVAVRQAGIAVPRAELCFSRCEAVSASVELGYPVVVKQLTSFGGAGVRLATCEEDLLAALAELGIEHEALMVQHYIECGARDKRVDVVAGTTSDAYTRVATRDSFRSNVSLGGISTRSAWTAEESSIAEATARCLGANVVGVDVAQVTSVLPGREYLPLGSVFWMEANENPGVRPGYATPYEVVDFLLTRIHATRGVVQREIATSGL